MKKKREQERGARLRVLVVDDEDFVRFTLTAVLRGAGYEVEEARSVEEALGKVRRTGGPFHVLVTDIMMGEIDGFMFRDAVRRTHPTLPIVFLTSLVDEDGALSKRILGDVHSYFLSKGVARDVLLDVVRHATHVSRCERALLRMTENFKHGMELASFVQRSVLPKWAHVGARYRFGYFWRPFSKVSGDLIAWFPFSSDACLAVFGDISGHGTYAALAMMGVQVFLKQLLGGCTAQDVRPHRILQELNGFFRLNLPDSTYMACLVAFWDFSKNEVRFHNAGYQELYCFRAATGARVDLNPERRGGVPVGLLPDTRYEAADDVSAAFPDDAVFMTCSDGILDLASDIAGEQFVEKAFVERTMGALAAESARDRDVSELAAELFQSLADCGWDVPQDDVFTFALAFRVELLLGEHLTNIVRHGLDETVRRFEQIVVLIAPAADPGLLAVKTLDRGRPWNPARQFTEMAKGADARLEEQNEKFALGGRGTAIKRKLVSSVRHCRVAGMNRDIFYVPMVSGALWTSTEVQKA